MTPNPSLEPTHYGRPPLGALHAPLVRSLLFRHCPARTLALSSKVEMSESMASLQRPLSRKNTLRPNKAIERTAPCLVLKPT
jgi:hypothetical protein